MSLGSVLINAAVTSLVGAQSLVAVVMPPRHEMDCSVAILLVDGLHCLLVGF